jgi:dolichol-phosphate mannosyltransferase
VKFCLVGGSGVFVDMGVLFLLADPRCLGLNVTLSKVCSAEAAMISNFVWNEVWTFRQRDSQPSTFKSQHLRLLLRRFLLFNAICGAGIGLAVVLLHLFHTWLGWNLYLSNMSAITLVTCWNFGMNVGLNWHTAAPARPAAAGVPSILPMALRQAESAHAERAAVTAGLSKRSAS